MASELYVETLKGLTSGANANTVTVGSGQTLYAPGHVLQVVKSEYTTTDTFSSTTYAETGLSASITPLSTSSTILVMAKNFFSFWTNTTEEGLATVRLRRGSTDLIETPWDFRNKDATDVAKIPLVAAIDYEDSPNTTSQVTYTTQYKLANSTNVTLYGQNNNHASTIVLMEIAG